MSEPEQCIICLDHLPRPSSLDGEVPAATTVPEAVEEESSYLNIVAALDGCDHIIHDACIRSWAQKTNTCPICRNPFHSVRVYDGVDGESTLSLPLASMRPPADMRRHQEPSYRNTKSKIKNKLPNSMYYSGWVRIPRKKRIAETHAQFATRRSGKTSCSFAIAAMPPTTPIASAWIIFPTVTGIAWNVPIFSTSSTTQNRLKMGMHRLALNIPEGRILETFEDTMLEPEHVSEGRVARPATWIGKVPGASSPDASTR